MWRGAALACMLGIERGNSMLGRGHRDHPGSGHGLLTALWPHCTAGLGSPGHGRWWVTVLVLAGAECRLETVPVCQQPASPAVEAAAGTEAATTATTRHHRGRTSRTSSSTGDTNMYTPPPAA